MIRRALRLGSLRDRPIRQKLMVLIGLATIVGLLFAAGAVSVYELATRRSRALRDARTLALVVAANTLPALMFDDSTAALQDLESLSGRPEIGSAAVYRADGVEFARYRRPGGPAPISTAPDQPTETFADTRLVMTVPLQSDGVVHGWLRIQYLMPGLSERMPEYALVAVVVLVALAATAALLLATLGRSVSTPLLALASTARQLATRDDLGIRAPRYADDEIGAVTTAFNRMLDRLQEREWALQEGAAALRESETRLRLALSAATMQPWVLRVGDSDSADGTRAPDPSELAKVLATVHPEDRSPVAEAIARAVANNRPFEIEFRSLAGGAEERRIALRGLTQCDERGVPAQVIGVAQDITERRRLEYQLMQAQKMEAIGNLAGGIAHDFNNLLTGMIGHLNFAQRALPAGTQVRSDVDQVEIAARRAAALTSQLLSYARRQMVVPTVVNMNETTRALAPMLRRVLGETVEVVLDLAPDLWAVKVDSGQLEQVIMNLAVNARDAMPDGGRLTLSTGNRRVSAQEVQEEDVAAGEFAEIAVSDNGVGMAPEVAARIFEPFFTTKPVGQGTGLGLAMCYGIAKQADGYIRVESGVGRGATLRVRLPRASERPAPDATAAAASVSEGGHETILLAEDDHGLRELAARTLREAGYIVLEAADGPGALEAARAHPGTVDLLLTDVVMPVQSGPELAAELRRARPSLQVLFISGYTEVIAGGDGRPSADLFLAKPFSPDDLRRATRRALEASRAAPA